MTNVKGKVLVVLAAAVFVYGLVVLFQGIASWDRTEEARNLASVAAYCKAASSVTRTAADSLKVLSNPDIAGCLQ